MDFGNIIGSDSDVTIMGAGAAGLAAAITTAAAGLSTLVIDAAQSPHSRPCEALHPGVETIFTQLGILDEINASSPIRYSGIYKKSAGRNAFVPFGNDSSGPWRGYQIGRERLIAILRARAVGAGAVIAQPVHVTEVERVQERWVVRTNAGQFNARYLFDASGPGHWLARKLGLSVRYLSSRLIARYGYGPNRQTSGDPEFIESSAGWIWTAIVQPGIRQWVGLPLKDGSELPAPPGMRLKGADVSWRVVERCAGSGYFLIGDAAAVLDPACSHGVLRALMSGIYAGSLASSVIREVASDVMAAGEYRRWLLKWVCADALELVHRYAQMPSPPEWLQTAAAACSEIWSSAEASQVTTSS